MKLSTEDICLDFFTITVPCSFDQKNKLLNLDYNYHIVCYFLSLFFYFFLFFISGFECD
jgi:hypothetical protein